jgi:copper chaperone CopZ
MDSTLQAIHDDAQEVTLAIGGMSCGACAGRIRDALMKQDGVLSARVALTDSAADVQFDPARIDVRSIIAAIDASGYEAWPKDVDMPSNASLTKIETAVKPVIIGSMAALGVIGFYLGLLPLTSDWSNAVYQFSDYRWWIAALAVGLGIQVGLFVRMRQAAAGLRLKGAASGMAASGGVSGVAMAICCSHYLAAVLPLIGLPFLYTAVAGLEQYQTQFFTLGVISNLLGMGYMLRILAKNGLLPNLPIMHHFNRSAFNR